MVKQTGMALLALAALSFAEETFIRNLCDTLSTLQEPNRKVEVRLAYVDETRWYGDKDLSKADSVKQNRHQDYSTLVPIYVSEGHIIPYTITAGCVESQNNLYSYAEWNKNQKNWSLNSENDDYTTVIWDVNSNSVEGYDPSNTYNILVFKKGQNLEELSSENMMVSRTFELNFESWYAIGLYKTVTQESETSSRIRTTAMFATRMDSASAIRSVIDALDIPDSISKVEVQLFHSVLNDPSKNEAESSSSESSSSSMEGTTVIGGFQKAAPHLFDGKREMRRLDGSRVKMGELLAPGVYYVKGADGRWKKQVEILR